MLLLELELDLELLPLLMELELRDLSICIMGYTVAYPHLFAEIYA